MTDDAATPVNTDAIKEAYDVGLCIFGRRLQKRSEVLELHGTLRGYIGILLPEVTALVPKMRGSMRPVGVHALGYFYQVLEELDAKPLPAEEEAPLAGRAAMRDRDAVFELASVCRSLLALVTQPGPLGSPKDVDEIEKAIKRRVCGTCWQPITDGEPTERKAFASDTTGGFNASVHAIPCTPRRPLLMRVPPQPEPA
ncbi:hypothetical protein ACGFZQ_27610 [Streptomyces sp. NPDC048254]|uniref:hypothetical protein n=1 Tax=Streptomyces sp. NPDC048254 TaxID=3365525 RepID=UPI003715056A